MTERLKTLIVCINMRFQSDKGSCAEKGSEDLADALERAIADRNININLERIRCLGECANGPSMRLAPGGKFYLHVKPADIPNILDEIEALCGTRPDTGDGDKAIHWPGI